MTADFDSFSAIKNSTPSGGFVHIGLGDLIFEDGTKNTGIGFHIVDDNENTVAEFALQKDTLEIFLDTLFQVLEKERNKIYGD